jgi:hypothetical protein
VANSNPPTPRINDAYWFDYSKSIVDGALKARDDAADKLQAFVGWLWVLYTAGAAVGINLGKLSLGVGATALVSAPVIALMIVYWLTILVRTPTLLQFDPRVPQEIASVYEHNVLRKQRRLRITLILAAVAGGLVATALFYTSANSSSATGPSLAASTTRADGAVFLRARGNMGAATSGALSIFSFRNKQKGTLLDHEVLVLDNGTFRSGLIKLAEPVTDAVLVEATALVKDGTTVFLSKAISVAPP